MAAMRSLFQKKRSRSVALPIVGAVLLAGAAQATGLPHVLHDHLSAAHPSGSGSTNDGLRSSSAPKAKSFVGTPAVGALVMKTSSGGLGSHFCSASVIASKLGDIVMTAAHCVGVSSGSYYFVPGYHGGKAPYGAWSVSAVFTDANWKSDRDQDDDFAFLVIAKSPSGKTVQSATGGEALGIDRAPVETVQVDGYPDGQSNPITCTNRTKQHSQTQLEFDCGGYTDGTSGSPFLSAVNSGTDLGTVIGVIGGYEKGGDSSSVSYAARLLSGAERLFETASSSQAAAEG